MMVWIQIHLFVKGFESDTFHEGGFSHTLIYAFFKIINWFIFCNTVFFEEKMVVTRSPSKRYSWKQCYQRRIYISMSYCYQVLWYFQALLHILKWISLLFSVLLNFHDQTRGKILWPELRILLLLHSPFYASSKMQMKFVYFGLNQYSLLQFTRRNIG